MRVMTLVRWGRDEAIACVDSVAVDELDGHVLVLDDVTAADDPALTWTRRAPCVVLGVAARGEPCSVAVDIALTAEQDDAVEALVKQIEQHSEACRVLVDVLRAVPEADIVTGLTLESLGYSLLLAGSEFARWLASRPEPRPRTYGGPPVRVARNGAELRITLARPENRNALSAAMRDALIEALALTTLDPTVEAVALDADGPSFCSGGDLNEFGTAIDVVRAHQIRTLRSVGALLAELAPAVTVQVHGACVGAGIELPAFAGRVIADPDSTFRLPEISMGLIPGAGGTVSITHRIGRQNTARLAISGEPITAEQALNLGLVDELHPRSRDADSVA